MPKYVLLILLFLFGAGYAHAQQRCGCCKLRDAGQAEYNAKRYEEAIRKWQSAKKLSDAAKCNDLDDLIANANKRISERSKPAPKPASQKTTPAKTNPGKKPATTTAQPKTPASTAVKTNAPDRFVKIEGGTFQMGDIMGDKEYNNETLHPVTVSTFYLSPYEVTFEEYDRYCETTGKEKPGDQSWGRGKRPAINVSWYDAVEYCNWRSQQAKLKPVYTINGTNVSADWSANGYRLPTEAEWEYAARAVNGKGGGKVRFGNGKDVADPKEINFDGRKDYKKPYSIVGEYRGKTTPVGDFPPNSLGLYDMSGNVWEWCWDWYDTYPTASQTDPKGASSGSYRVYRGGSWSSFPVGARCAKRVLNAPDNRSSNRGFRLARAAR